MNLPQPQPEDTLVCPRCKGELFVIIYRMAEPRNSGVHIKKPMAYFCVTCNGTFPCQEVRPKRDASSIIQRP